jgi:hypothetical protein
VIVFDESHALANAAGEKSERGDKAASQQGRAGLRLQHALPDARVLYVSATGATAVHNLAYAQRLGLWGGADFPFATRAEFVQAIEAGGVAAMEVLARDLKALGLYASRSLSYEGVEYELIEHALTPEQVRIYDAYAGAFQIIHNNLTAALEATNVIGSSGTLNAQAKAAARSAFESAKQRFFNHLITAMKAPSLIAAIDRDLAAGHAAIVQIVSTGEALMERRLAEIPTEEWGDVSVDITPREYVLDYLAHSFPTQLYEPYTDEEGNLASRPVFRGGQPVQCRDAVERRDRMIERLAALPPVPGALDQIVQRFGIDQVAEVNARSGRAAVQMPAPSLMLDDGEIERRVRLIRPMERNAIAVNAEWHEAGRDAFATALNKEVAAVPEYATSSFHIVTGLLLPIWTRLPQDSSRVYRLQTDAGERVIGCLVSPAWIAQTIDTEAPSISPDDAWNALLDGKTGLELADGLEIRRSRIMGEHRIELTGFTDGMVDRLKAMGLTSEIISWRLRLFVPVVATAPTILAALMEAPSACPRRGAGSVRCPAQPANWRAASRARPRRCAAPISPMAAARVAIGRSAISTTRQDAAFTSGSRAASPDPPPPPLDRCRQR